MTKPITLRDDLYEKLTKMKNGELHSFSDVISHLIDEKNEFDKWKKEIQRSLQ